LYNKDSEDSLDGDDVYSRMKMNEEEYGRANKYQNKTNRVNILK